MLDERPFWTLVEEHSAGGLGLLAATTLATSRRGQSPLAVSAQLMTKLFDTVTGLPANGGTFALRKMPATQPPTGVPAKGGPWTVALVTRPLGANVTCTLPVPVGPPAFLQ